MSELPTIPTGADGEDMTAGEYALGVLTQDERTAAEARMRAEPAFAAEVEAWQERLYPMVDAIRPRTPPAHIWPRIARLIGDGPKVVDLNQRRAVTFWRGWAVAASAVAAVAILLLSVKPIQAPTPPAPAPSGAVEPMMVAELADPKGRGFITATYDPRTGVLKTAPNTTLPVPKTRSPELWLIPKGGAPVSLGVIDGTHPTTVTLTAALKPGAGPDAVLAITWEQPGGSPDGKPHAKPTWVGKLESA